MALVLYITDYSVNTDFGECLLVRELVLTLSVMSHSPAWQENIHICVCVRIYVYILLVRFCGKEHKREYDLHR